LSLGGLAAFARFPPLTLALSPLRGEGKTTLESGDLPLASDG